MLDCCAQGCAHQSHGCRFV